MKQCIVVASFVLLAGVSAPAQKRAAAGRDALRGAVDPYVPGAERPGADVVAARIRGNEIRCRRNTQVEAVRLQGRKAEMPVGADNAGRSHTFLDLLCASLRRRDGRWFRGP